MFIFMPVLPAILMRNERLSDSLSYRVALSFQWVPGHAGLTGYELADSLETKSFSQKGECFLQRLRTPSAGSNTTPGLPRI